ncbi:TPA: histidine--tRNA ligase [Candidatus Poribacteria bacterium]|nr:histidine--tRNA ligase [Candidatus Poribacteria bacterium]
MKAVRGTKDITPDEVYKWQYVESIAKDVFENFGFREIRTPIFEHTELFIKGTGETTDIVQKEMYTFTDKGGRSLTLRPEGTPPVVRSYLENNLSAEMPVTKLYYIGPMFRYERPQAGRFRQHQQIGAEIIGSSSPYSDAELISMYLHFVSKLGIEDVKLHLNSVGCAKCKPDYNLALKDYAKKHFDSLCETCKDRLDRNPLRMLDCKVESCREIFASGPVILDYLCDDCRKHFDIVIKSLNMLGLQYNINPFLVRGLDYYTKTVFEVTARGLGSQDAIAGGGRYDNLIEELGGKPTPALGFGSGQNRLIATMEAQNTPFADPPVTKIYIAPLCESAFPKAFEIAFLLRQKGVSTEIGLDGRSLKSQMKTADKLRAKYVVMIGEDEINKGFVTIRDMVSGEQEAVDFQIVIDVLTKK